MLSSEQLLLILVFAVISAWWWRHLGIRQLALAHARKACQKANVQLLDQSVYLRKIRLARSPVSLVTVERSYEFEFSTRGDRRFLGWVVLTGRRLQRLELQPYSDDNWLQ
ncbi:hypothetical protein BGP77_13745 [Saccharospirillum sp. MSK14-1]|uniref:DUF3301 domain-containing protein n=1 Tax=Saccharospirillum sp. MSK14-1 TaxID=1897632 RepID=UPI000D369973|nr:DUF3301 domain-containing protein [Saccharospirillum sp. MSK14-1]PTY37557.1 hypothetical protein BGP77_13745 [Saccharospirillum sp. MSK14-1]